MKKSVIYTILLFFFIFITFSYCSISSVNYPGDKWIHLSGSNIGDLFYNEVDYSISWPFINGKRKTVAYTLFAIDNRLFIINYDDLTIGVYKKE